MRFQKRIKILPGVTINLSRKGVSTSVGVTGARVTYGHGEKRTTIGMPGTGISHTEVERITPAKPPPRPTPALGALPGKPESEIHRRRSVQSVSS